MLFTLASLFALQLSSPFPLVYCAHHQPSSSNILQTLPTMSVSVPAHIPKSEQAARILFGNGRYTRYLFWQRDIANEDQSQHYDSRKDWEDAIEAVDETRGGEFPTGYQYKIFMQYLRARGDLFLMSPERPQSTLQTAVYCGHAIHPGSPEQTPDMCPMCEIDLCNKALDKIWEAWQLLGIQPETGYTSQSDRDLARNMREVYRAEKTKWANLVHMFELCAEDEEKWGNAHLNEQTQGKVLEIRGSASCMKAARRAWEKCPGIPNLPPLPPVLSPQTPTCIAPPKTNFLSPDLVLPP